MAYVDYEYYKTLYNEPEISETDFKRYAFEACKKVDRHTTGADGIKKLKFFFPVSEDDVQSVKRCIVALIEAMHKIRKAEENAQSSRGYVQRDDGTLHGRVVTSITSGNESISFSGNTGNATLIEKALSDPAVQNKMYNDIITEYLSGTEDANGVNLLYMGRYPY